MQKLLLKGKIEGNKTKDDGGDQELYLDEKRQRMDA